MSPGSAPRRQGALKTLLLLLLLEVFQSSASAHDALEPCRDERNDPYHTRVNGLIDKAVGKPSSIRLTTYPSFASESGLRIVGNELYFVEFARSFWDESFEQVSKHEYRMNFKKPDIRTRTRHAPLSALAADRIRRVYASAIAQPKESGHMGLDGVSYVFTTSDGACAWTWSPEPSTRTGRLVELLKRLEKHATLSLPIDLQRSEKNIMQLVRVMEAD